MQGFIHQAGNRYVSVLLFKDAGKEKTQAKAHPTIDSASSALNKMMAVALYDRVRKYLNHRIHVMQASGITDKRYAMALFLQSNFNNIPATAFLRLVHWVREHQADLYAIAPRQQSIYHLHDQQVLLEIMEDVHLHDASSAA